MKVLSMTWSIYDDRLKQFANNFTGGGLVIKNICEYIGRKCDSYLFIGAYKLPEMEMGHIRFVGTDKEMDVQDEQLSSEEIRLRTMTNAFIKALETICPDIVNFHGLGVLVKRCMEVCIERNVPYVYTEHLYVGIHQEIAGYARHIEWEKNLYAVPGIKMINVSTGMKKNILRDFPKIAEQDISVILNGTDFVAERIDSDLRERYKLAGKKVLLCVGTVSHRKRQEQIVNAFRLFPAEQKEQIKVLFCGKDAMEGRLQNAIAEAGLEEHLIYVGALSSEEMKKYYSVADGLIMPSFAEGLSIAALEAIAYGLPVIMSSDSECADDLKDEQVVCFAQDRSDRSLADAIIKWQRKDWDKDHIMQYAKYFTMDRMADDYIRYYQSRLGR